MYGQDLVVAMASLAALSGCSARVITWDQVLAAQADWPICEPLVFDNDNVLIGEKGSLTGPTPVMALEVPELSPPCRYLDGRVTVSGDDAVIVGAVNRSSVEQVLGEHLGEIGYCYQRVLAQDASLQGAMTVKFTITSDGSSSQAMVQESTLGNPVVEACIIREFLGMQFEEPRDGGVALASYDLLFGPSE